MLDRGQLQQLYRYGLSLTQNTSDAHDLLQSALEKWIKQGKQECLSLAYIRAIMRNQFIDNCRRHNLVSFESLEDDTPVVLDELSLEQHFINEDMVHSILEHLNATEREVLYLWAVLGFTASEIANELETSRNTILSRLFRVKKKAQAVAEVLETPVPHSREVSR